MEQKKQFLAGALAGGGTTAILHPLDLIKVRLQLDSTTSSSGTFSELARIRRTFGFKSGLYQGFSANWTASMASWGCYFYLYSKLKGYMIKDSKQSSMSVSYFAASGIAGATTVVLVNPLWVAKVRMCSRPFNGTGPYRTLLGTLRSIFLDEGIVGLYRGLLPGLFGVTHGAVQFTVYENLKLLNRRYGLLKEETSTCYLATSILSKTVAMLTTYPYQVVRSRAQLPQVFGSGILKIIRQTWLKEGVAGFYRGIVPSTIRVLPGTALTFLIYENAIKLL